MNTYKLILDFPETNDSTWIFVQAKSEQDAIRRVKYNPDKINVSIQTVEKTYGTTRISTVYIEPARVSDGTMNDIYRCILTPGNRYAVISETVRFSDGTAMDICACGGDDGEGWARALLYCDGRECNSSDDEDKFEGVWELVHDDNLYISVVIPESPKWLSPNVILMKGSCLESGAPVIAQHVNCLGITANAGMVAFIQGIYPEVAMAYKAACNSQTNTQSMAGKCQMVDADDGKVIANLFGQLTYKSGLRADYDILQNALNSLGRQMDEREFYAVAMPFGIACGLEEGDWGIVLDMLKKTADRNLIRIELWKD